VERQQTFGTGRATSFVMSAWETPDGGYYVGLDMPGAMHPQTLLCYEMGGRPLTLAHGAPLRLVTTVKYGIKSISASAGSPLPTSARAILV